MIFNKSEFKKLLKKAYKGAGLLVAKADTRYILEGNWWVITMEEQVFNNNGRAAVVELAGSLPERGECWRSTSAGNQMEILPTEYIEIDKSIRDKMEEMEPYEKTIVTFEYGAETVRIYQRKHELVCFDEQINQLLDNTATEAGEDVHIRGPYLVQEGTDGRYYWYTENCSFAADSSLIDKMGYEHWLQMLADMIIPRSEW